MIADQVRDAMDEIEEAWQDLDSDSTEWELLHLAYRFLGDAHSLVFLVNRMRLGALINGKKEQA